MSMPSSEGAARGQGGGGEPVPGRLESAAEAEEHLRRAQAKGTRPRMNVQQIHSWVDVEIEQAQRRGDFDNLPGAGKPLKNLDQDDPDWWVKSLIEREKLDMSAALPTVMALRQERRGFPESLAGISDEVAVRERLEDYNARVIEDRRKPVVGANSPAIAGRVDVDEMLEQWRQLREDRARPVVDPDVESAAQTEAALTDQQPVDRAQQRIWVLLLVLVALVALIWALA
ncbi:DUF1992 domain-containing protein [Ornithinimicrobium faecis]|uniref:DnaJ family domain-containing protein n=1 Tax=Ornithinimicrobium faecis TaxID=2934158 RepID=UPI0021185507|nr:DUF1992 domain-containing protein [Ornithinimicrobium sp. HY1745]